MKYPLALGLLAGILLVLAPAGAKKTKKQVSTNSLREVLEPFLPMMRKLAQSVEDVTKDMARPTPAVDFNPDELIKQVDDITDDGRQIMSSLDYLLGLPQLQASQATVMAELFVDKDIPMGATLTPEMAEALKKYIDETTQRLADTDPADAAFVDRCLEALFMAKTGVIRALGSATAAQQRMKRMVDPAYEKARVAVDFFAFVQTKFARVQAIAAPLLKRAGYTQ